MSTKYSIIIKNKSQDSQRYLIFNDPPKASKNVGKAWSNIWMKTGGTPTPNGTQNLTIEIENFAVCGTTPTPLGHGVSVKESDYASVSLTAESIQGTAPVMKIVDDTPAFTQPYSSVDLANSFGIVTDAFNPEQYRNVYCGYGKYDDTGNVVPVAVWTAKPSQIYEVTPVVTYYVSTGDFHAGDVVDVTTLGAIAKIDFTTAKAGQTMATITHEIDGRYSGPVFTYPPTKRRR
ncbi:hypothetical protein DPSP01_014336 [Paraphaeosphaeria sporulosa]